MGTKWIHDFQWVPAGTHWKVWIHFCSFICLTWIHTIQWVPAGTHWKAWIHFCSFICLTWIHTIQWVPAGTHWKLWIHFCSFIWLTWIHTIQWVPAGTHWKVWIHFATEKDRQKLDIFCFKFRKKNIQNLSNFYLNPAVHKSVDPHFPISTIFCITRVHVIAKNSWRQSLRRKRLRKIE